MKYLIILFVVSLSFQLKSEVNLEIKNSRNSDSLYYQNILTDTLILTNNSEDIISITDIGLSCGCTVVSESQFEINANSVKRVPFTVDLEHTTMGKSINISIMTSNNDTIPLNYNYKVREILIVDPHFISITSPNKFVQYELKIINTSEEKIYIIKSNSKVIVGNKLKFEILKNEIDPGETINARIELNELESNNVGKLDFEYLVSNGIVLHKSIDYIINKGN